MGRKGRFTEHTIILFVFGLLAFNYPVLSTVNRLSLLWGIPALFLYVFVVWFLVIVAIAFNVKRWSKTSSNANKEIDSR